MTLACEATVSGTIYVSSNVLNYREVLTTRSHWGQEVPSISLTELAKDDNLQMNWIHMSANIKERTVEL